MEFPDDENGNVLRKMQERGDDLSKPRDINLYVAFPDQESARNFAEEVRSTTKLTAEASRYQERNMWQASVTQRMVPTYSEITALEQSLNYLAKAHGGEADGWGCFKQ